MHNLVANSSVVAPRALSAKELLVNLNCPRDAAWSTAPQAEYRAAH
jgi:hypothetical protein